MVHVPRIGNWGTGDVAYALGNGEIQIGKGNRMVFNHVGAAGDRAVLKLNEGGKAVMNTNGRCSRTVSERCKTSVRYV